MCLQNSFLEQGPIFGQTIQPVDALLKNDDKDKHQLETVFLPFQFQYSFPVSSVVMSSAASTKSAGKHWSCSTDSFEMQNNDHDINITSDSENESHTKMATDDISTISTMSDASVKTSQNSQAENMMVELQPLPSINLDSALFKNHQFKCNGNFFDKFIRM